MATMVSEDYLDEEKEADFEEMVEEDDMNPEDGGVMQGFDEVDEDEDDSANTEYEAAFGDGEETQTEEVEEEEDHDDFEEEY